MTTAKDILLDGDNELRIEGGDFVVGYSDGQNVKLMLYSEQGSWRMSPVLGIGIRRGLNTKMDGKKALAIKKRIYSNLESDGLVVNAATITATGKLSLNFDRV